MAANPGDPITPVIDRLTAIIANAEAQASRTGYFAGLYRRVTIAVRDQIESFDDPVRLARLDVIFASRYLDALAAWQAGQPCSSCWQVAFTATQSAQPIILQHLLLGINAHINRAGGDRGAGGRVRGGARRRAAAPGVQSARYRTSVMKRASSPSA